MNISIREWEMEDAADLALAINDKKVQDNLRDGIPFPYTQKDAEEFIRAMQNAEKGRQYVFAIALDGKAIGSIGITRKDNIHNRTVELGYYISQAYWGKGIMTTAVRLVCEFAFEHTDIIRIFAEPFAYNVASCKVLEKAGFQCEGTMRSNAVKNGRVIDMKMYAMIKENT